LSEQSEHSEEELVERIQVDREKGMASELEQVERVGVDSNKGVLLWIRGRPYPLKAIPFSNVVDLLDVLKAPLSSLIDTLLSRYAGVIRKYLPPKTLVIADKSLTIEVDPFTRSIKDVLDRVIEACNSSGTEGGKTLARRLECGRDIGLAFIWYDTSYRWLLQIMAWLWTKNLLEKHKVPEELKREILSDIIDTYDEYWIRLKRLWDANLIFKGEGKDG
jgi:hypothetical protein